MWSWHLAHPTVSPMNAVDTVSTADNGKFPGILVVPDDASASQKPEGEHVVRPGFDAGSVPDRRYLSRIARCDTRSFVSGRIGRTACPY